MHYLFQHVIIAYKIAGDILLQKASITLYKDEEKVYENKKVKVKYNKSDNIISYFDEVLTKIIWEKEGLIFKRTNEEYEFSLEIKEENNCNIYLKKENIQVDIEVEKATYKKAENYLEIEYKIETDDATNKVIIVKN